MKITKWLSQAYPELYFIASILFYWQSTTPVNPAAWILLLLIGLQLYFKKAKPGIIISSFLAFASFFFLLALFSEFKEFPAGNEEGIKMVIIGSSWLLTNIILSIIMLVKYINKATAETTGQKT